MRSVPDRLGSDQRSLVLRADAGQHRGYGHVMRSVTLGAEFHRQGWTVRLLGEGINDFLRRRAESYGIEVQSLGTAVGCEQDAERVSAAGSDLVLIDGYEFGDDYFGFLDDHGRGYAVIDDNGPTAPHGARFIVNQNVHATRALYPHVSAERLLLGPRYCMIRNEVQAAHAARSSSSTTDMSILVAIGGTDPLGLNQVIASTLSDLCDVEVVVPLASPPGSARRAEADIAVDLAGSSVAVIGGGSTLWEACFLGVPCVALVVADNQIAAASMAHDMGVAIVVDCRTHTPVSEIGAAVTDLLDSSARREQMSAAGRRLIDGQGAGRIVECAESLMVAL